MAWSAPLSTDTAEGSDLSATSGTVTFAADAPLGATQTITITATDDALSETSEGFTVTLGRITSALSAQVSLKSGASSATATIAESDPITINISGPSTVDEGDATTSYTVALSPTGVKPSANLTVSYNTASGTATSGTDFTAKSGTFTFTEAAAGSRTFTVQTTEDNVDEGTGETFTVSISSPSGGGGPSPSLGTTSVSTTITDDDAAPDVALSASPSTIGEDEGATSVTVTATLQGSTRSSATTVTIGTLTGTATKDTDYTASTLSTITIPANSATGTGTLTITPTDDELVEGDETITIPGTAPGLTVSEATVTLTDDNKATTPPGDTDSAEVSITGPASPVSEGSAASFTVTLSKSVAAEVTVGWTAPLSTDDAEGSDLSDTSGKVIFPANSSAGATQTITITAIADLLSETSEEFTVTLGTITSTLSSQVSLKSGASSATAEIAESDPIVVKLSGPSSVTEGEGAVYTVALTPEGVTPTADLTVDYATDPGTAEEGNDFTATSGTLTFTRANAAPQTVTVATVEDTLDEKDETFTITISNPQGGGGPEPTTDSTIPTTIVDDDNDGDNDGDPTDPDPDDPDTPTPDSDGDTGVVGEEPVRDYTATFEACIGPALEPWGFEDIPTVHNNSEAIDCLAYYVITKGTGDGTNYSPSPFVSRWQLALFLTRMARRVGIKVNPTPADAGFTDIADRVATETSDRHQPDSRTWDHQGHHTYYVFT